MSSSVADTDAIRAVAATVYHGPASGADTATFTLDR